MSELQQKVRKSIDRLKAFEPPEGYYLAFSGGKDSVVCKALMDMSGVKYDAHYRVTSVDPPELYNFVREKHPDVARDKPKDADGNTITMWNLIPRKYIPPTRRIRYCCAELKEDGGDGRMCVTGVRWAESINRKKNQGEVTIVGKSAKREFANHSDFALNSKGGVILINDNAGSRRMVEQCYQRHKTNINPIIEWSDDDVWNFIRAETVPYCSLYDEGFTRIGCIGCPMAGQHMREREFLLWPKYKQSYLNAFAAMLEVRKQKGLPKPKVSWPDAESVFNWWMEYDVLPGQMEFENLTEVQEWHRNQASVSAVGRMGNIL